MDSALRPAYHSSLSALSSYVGPAAMRGLGGEIEAGHRSAPARAARPLLRFNTGSQPSHGAARRDERFG